MSIQRRHPDGTSSMLPPQGPGPVDTSSEVRLAIVEEGLLAEIHDLNERLDEARAERDAALAKIQRVYALVWPQCPCIDPGDNPECPYHSGKPLTVDVADIRAILAGQEDRNNG